MSILQNQNEKINTFILLSKNKTFIQINDICVNKVFGQQARQNESNIILNCSTERFGNNATRHGLIYQDERSFTLISYK